MVYRELRHDKVIDERFVACHKEGAPYPSQRYEGMQVYDTVTFELKTWRDGKWIPIDPEPKGITIRDL